MDYSTTTNTVPAEWQMLNGDTQVHPTNTSTLSYTNAETLKECPPPTLVDMQVHVHCVHVS